MLDDAITSSDLIDLKRMLDEAYDPRTTDWPLVGTDFELDGVAYKLNPVSGEIERVDDAGSTAG